MAAPASPVPFTRSVAVVIGIDDYQREIPALRTATSDARRVADVLDQEHGYEVIRAFDAEASLARLTQLFTADLASRVCADDRVLVYFAGHGVALDGDDGPRGYLIPQDARSGDAASYLSMTSVHDALLALSCRHMLLVLDCCFAGAFRWSATRDLGRSSGAVHRERFDRFVRDPAWQVLTSASHDQRALDVLSSASLGSRDDGGVHSPFAHAFLDALAGAGDLVPRPDGDGLLTATELYLYLEDRLQPVTIDAGVRQTPGLWPLKRHDKGEFLFFIPGRALSLPPAPPLTFERNPYRGLESYEREHAATFHGRERVVEALGARVQAHALTVVLGASGTGKSSVVKAGLVPALERQSPGVYHVLPIVRPGTHPVTSLRQAFQALDASDPVDAVQRWASANPDRQLVLVVDQLEELVTLCASPAERTAALELLARLLDVSPTLRVIATLRTDFEPQLANGALATRWTEGRYIVPPVSQAELRQIIERPASDAVMYFEPSALVDTLIDEVVQTPGGLPLLSFTLSEMYVRSVKAARGDRALAREDYEALGGVVGALRHAANEAFEELDAPHRETMRRVMLRMVSASGGNVTRRRVPLPELEFDETVIPGENARVRHVLDSLVEARLVVRGSDADGVAYVEPAHDALVSAWDRLIGWIHEANQQGPSLATRERLARASEEWSRGDRRLRSGLVWRDSSRAAQLGKLLSGRADWLNAREREFARRSVRSWRFGIAAVVGAVLAIAGGGVAATIFGLDARRQGLEAQRAALQADSAAKRAQSNAIASLARAESNPVVRAQLLGEIARAGLPDPTSGVALAMQTMRDLDASVVPSVVGIGWGFAEGRNEDGTTAGVLMSPTIERVYAGGHEISAYAFSRVGAPEAAAIDPMPRDEYEQPWGAAAAFADHVVQYHSGSRYATRVPAKRLGAHGARVNRLAFSRNAGWLVSSSDDGTARRWHVESGDSTAVFDAHDGAVTDVAISRDGSVVATAHASGISRAWRVEGTTAREVARLTGASPAASIGISADGAVIATGDSAGKVTVWDAASGRVRLTLDADSTVVAVALTYDGSGVAYLAGDSLTFARGDGPSTPISHSLSYWLRGQGVARTHDFAQPQWTSRFPAGAPRPRIAIDDDGTRALVVGQTARLAYWPVLLPSRTPESVTARDSATSPVAGPAWTARIAGGSIEVAGRNGKPSYTFTPQGSLGGREGTSTHFRFGPDSSSVAVWHFTGSQWNMSAFRLSDGKKLQSMGSAGELMCLALSPGGTAIAWCRTRFTPEIVPLPPEVILTENRGSIRHLPVPTIASIDTTDTRDFNFVRGIAFSPDGESVLIWGDYRDAVIARIDGTGATIVLPPHAAEIVSGRFTSGGRAAVLTSADSVTRTYPLAFEDLIAALDSRITSCLRPAQRVQYLTESDSASQANYRACEVRRRGARR